MEPTVELIEALRLEKIERARLMPEEEKLLAGVRIFERVCRVMKDGIRWQFPNVDEVEVERILRERLALARRLENGR
jgi:hypothetical protein